MAKKLTTEEAKERVLKVHKGKIILLKFNGTSKPCDFSCAICNHKWTTTLNSVCRDKASCFPCSRKAIAEISRLKSKNTFVKDVEKKHGDKISLKLFKYIKNNVNGIALCNICNHDWEVTPRNLKGGRGCPKCYNNSRSEKNRHTKEQVLEHLNPLLKGSITLDDFDYENDRAKVGANCLVCDHKWPTTIGNLKQKPRCPNCSRIRVVKFHTHTKEQVLEYLIPILKGSIVLDDFDYENDRTKVGANCLICKHKWVTKIGYLKQRPSCPNCAEYNYKNTHKNGGRFYIYRRGSRLKFGKTNHSVEVRAKQCCKGVPFTIILDYYSDDAGMATYVENKIKADKSLITNQAQLDGDKFDGYTETVSEVNEDKLLALVDKYVKEWENA